MSDMAAGGSVDDAVAKLFPDAELFAQDNGPDAFQNAEQHQQKPFSQIAQQQEQQQQVFPNQTFGAAGFRTDCAAAGRTFANPSAPPETYFRAVPGTLKWNNGQWKQYFLCNCCPQTTFGFVVENDQWTHDLDRAVGWKNPQNMRTSRKEFLKSCKDHVNSHNGRHRFWNSSS